MIRVLELGGRHVADRAEQALVVVPRDPFEHGKLDLVGVAPRAAAADDLGFEQADDALGQRIVVRISDAADGAFEPRLGEPVGVADRQVLGAAVAMVDEALVRRDRPRSVPPSKPDDRV